MFGYLGRLLLPNPGRPRQGIAGLWMLPRTGAQKLQSPKTPGFEPFFQNLEPGVPPTLDPRSQILRLIGGKGDVFRGHADSDLQGSYGFTSSYGKFRS